MGKIKRYKNSVERFISSEGGQRFFNFAYSIGAAIVILGALFKILHLQGGNTLLSIGMGTEVMMFILTAFDRPPREYNWEEVFPVLASKNPEDRPDFAGGSQPVAFVTDPDLEPVSSVQDLPESAHVSQTPAAVPASMEGASEEFIGEMSGIARQMAQLKATTEALNDVSRTLLDSYRAITDNSETITSSSTGYVEQMQALNRNIAGLNTIYEIQLKSVSSQLDAIDRVNRGIKDICRMYENSAAQSSRYCEESERMTRHMQQLNQVYEKMLRAMTINMGAAMASPMSPASNTDATDSTSSNN
ncbi:MAG: gliding motility protein GldL [Paramuribaculum sp.]|nr:gliding motility protein GldL [Paramuribaculum sp.]